MSKKKPRDGLRVIKKQDYQEYAPFGVKSEADQQWWNYCMDKEGFNLYFRYSKDDMRAVGLYISLVDH